MRILTLVMVLIVLALQYRVWFGEYGARDIRELKQEVLRQQEANATVAQRNQLMYADIEDLRNAHEAVEERARNELGLIRENETFFRMIPREHETTEESESPL
ncbi:MULTISPECIES: cell division protein FtsB [Gammaproteobacteria]|uniref:cell division protein FtsB n=1 Tax=Gammaproteobacteria TaxID=1236 RepID=UPI000DD03D47|nr:MULTISPECIES: cell division protein FtsB [Gammaproteobacteria]RTE87118.1 cell division protein FtsB [Aliidiomarina sp. B3213]TCZ93094.1 cell division protein FtsB [Lysobacter sp. N42]